MWVYKISNLSKRQKNVHPLVTTQKKVGLTLGGPGVLTFGTTEEKNPPHL
jgi:hypothetical protein